MSESTKSIAEHGIDEVLLKVRALMSRSGVELRDVRPHNLRMAMRAVLDLPRDATGPEEAGSKNATAVVLDVGAWLAWMEAGLALFAMDRSNADGPSQRDGSDGETDRHEPDHPQLRDVLMEARRVAVVQAMVRSRGNLSRAAMAVGTSRRAFRGYLQELGLYPWRMVLARCVSLENGRKPDRDRVRDGGGEDESGSFRRPPE